MTLRDLLIKLNHYEFIAVFDRFNNVIAEDYCMNDYPFELEPFLKAKVTYIGTGITNAHGSLHAVIGITIDDVVKEENQ